MEGREGGRNQRSQRKKDGKLRVFKIRSLIIKG
jgi:hypothetical protein